ncbi:MAG: histidine kinase, partial [Pseudomonadales bacterium]|nr:histidine kinase [Pseudomonadales bacterium]
MNEPGDSNPPFMPDLCRLPVVLAVLAVTQLLVIVYVLSLNSMARFDWELLSLLSLYAQWLSMLSVALLCNARGMINRLPTARAAAASFALVLVVVALTNAVAQWIYAGRSWGGWSLQWLLRDLFIVAVLAGIAFRYMYVQQQWLREQGATDSARLDALHARIRPHFLFNSMNTIASLIRFAPAEAESAVEDLAALMRASLSERESVVDWPHEQAICEAYLRIEQLRLGERLRVNWCLQAMPDNVLLPPLVVQPLLENAIYHGIEKIPAGGSIDIDVRPHGELLRIKIQNSIEPPAAQSPAGQLPTSHSLASKPAAGGRHNGIALRNIRARLASIYKSKDGHNPASLSLDAAQNSFVVCMDIPLQ